jgi:Zn-finger domain-containing protein
LKVSDNKGNTKSGYPRDVPAILIQGESTLLEKAYVITIKDPSGNFVKDKFGTTLSDGDISQAWIPINALGGTYLVTIKIDNKIDTIEFTLL